MFSSILNMIYMYSVIKLFMTLINHTDIFHGELSLLGLSGLPMMHSLPLSVNVCVCIYVFIHTKTDKILRNNLDWPSCLEIAYKELPDFKSDVCKLSSSFQILWIPLIEKKPDWGKLIYCVQVFISCAKLKHWVFNLGNRALCKTSHCDS